MLELTFAGLMLIFVFIVCLAINEEIFLRWYCVYHAAWPFVSTMLLLSITFWIFLSLISSFALQWYVPPRLERYYTKTYEERVTVRKRRLRQSLCDPVLVRDLEHQILRRRDIQGDRSKMILAMKELRERAAEEGKKNDDDVCNPQDEKRNDKIRNDARKEAAKTMFRATIVLPITFFSALNLRPLDLFLANTRPPLWWPRYSGDYYSYSYLNYYLPSCSRNSESYYNYYFYVTFFLVHLIHSFVVVRRVLITTKRRTTHHRPSLPLPPRVQRLQTVMPTPTSTPTTEDEWVVVAPGPPQPDAAASWELPHWTAPLSPAS